jgi:hypothetical protein
MARKNVLVKVHLDILTAHCNAAILLCGYRNKVVDSERVIRDTLDQLIKSPIFNLGRKY